MNDWFEAEQHVERAHELYEAGRWDEAERELRHALSLNPYQIEWHFNLGLTLEAAGRHADAADALLKANELKPDDAPTQLLIGHNLLRAGQAERSLAWFERVERLAASDRDEDVDAAPADADSDDEGAAGGARDPHAGPAAQAAVYRVEALTELARHDDAELVFYMAQQAWPENAELYAAMADSLTDRKLYDKAIWCLREAARLDADLPRVQARLADVYWRTGRLERARQLYLRELRLDPGDVDTLLDLGELLAEMHRDAEAGEKYHRVLELEPDNPDAHSSLADLAERRGVRDDAIVQLDVVLRLDAAYPGARPRLAGLLMERGLGEDALRAKRLLIAELKAYRAKPESYDAVAADELGQLLLDAGMPSSAASVFERLAETRAGDAAARHHLSVARFQLGQRDQGVRHAREALRLDPRFYPAMHNLAIASIENGHWLRARYWARQALRIAPDDPALRRLRLKLRLHAAVGLGRWALRAVGVMRPARPGWDERPL